jgi:membrane-associated phospholipid phosphatase
VRPFALATTLVFTCSLVYPLTAQQRESAPAPAIRWTHLLAAAGAVAAATTFDSPIATAIGADPSPQMRRAAVQLNRFGQVEVIAPVIGGLLAVGALTDRPHLVEAGKRTALAIGIATVAVSLKKYPLGRQRPYENASMSGGALRPMSGSTALPSGHTAAAFALATSLADVVDSPIADVTLYGLAAGTAFARMGERKHWFSDVVAGAIVGTVSAKLAHGNLSLFGLKAPRIGIGRNGAGVQWEVGLPAVR